MSASKRPSTSSLRRFITSRPFVTVAELRRRFGLDDPDVMTRLARNGTVAWIGLPEREAAKLQDLWDRSELGMELSVDVRASVVVGVYPMRIARYLVENAAPTGTGNGHPPTLAGNGSARQSEVRLADDGSSPATPAPPLRDHPHAPRPMPGAPSYRGADRPPHRAG